MNTSFTPGPWAASEKYIVAGNFHLAVTTNPPLGKNQEWEANAKLIAAAPDLLDVCLRFSRLPCDYNTLSDAEFVFRDIKKAIEKAIGKNNIPRLTLN